MRIMLVAAALILTGCEVSTDDPTAQFSAVRVQELGPDQFLISCVDSPKYCAQQAVKQCPGKFDVVSNVVNPADFGRMTMVIRCT